MTNPATTIEATGATLDWLHGNCPIQAEGIVDGNVFYFRARGSRWEFHVADENAHLLTKDLFFYSEPWGYGPYDAGWMLYETAAEMIVKAIGLYRAQDGK